MYKPNIDEMTIEAIHFMIATFIAYSLKDEIQEKLLPNGIWMIIKPYVII